MSNPHSMKHSKIKAKDFKGSMKKLFHFMKGSIPLIIVSLLVAVTSVVLSLQVPNIMGNATDELMSGFMARDFYKYIDAKVISQSNGELNIVSFAQSHNIADIGQLLDNYISSDEKNQLVDKMGNYSNSILNTPLDHMPGIDIDTILHLLTIAIIIVFISAATGYVQSFILMTISERTSYNLRKQIDEKIHKLPLKYYDKTTNGEVLSYLTNDVDTISTTLSQSLSELVTALTTILVVLIMMIRISFVMTIIAVLMVPLSIILIGIVVRISQKYFVKQQQYLGLVNGHIEEMYTGNNVVQLYNGQEDSVNKFSEINKQLAINGRKSQFISGLMSPLMKFVGNLGYVGICIVGGILATHGHITIGNIQAFIIYIKQFTQPITQLASITNTLQSTAAASEHVFDFLEQTDEPETGDKVLTVCHGDVDFVDVKFGYNPDKIILNDFTCSVKQGQRVAIVGPTGAGKTTVVKLLMRYYETLSGKILLDGEDITQYTRASLRAQFGMVLQDTWLFNGSIKENIRYGRIDATDEEVYNAARIAYADHFIQTMDGGYDFVLNEEADNISQGQKQLLTIARAVLNDPKVLILDEATSSVDTRTEELIQKAMDRLMEKRTCFIIAHRLSTIKDADIILVMNEGDIIEVGNHQQLMDKKGFYSDLYLSQFAHVE